MMRIHEELQDNTLPNCTKLAEKLDVSTKTVMRDLAFMRDRLGLPGEYDEQIYAYRYGYPVKNFPMVQIDEGELTLAIPRRDVKPLARDPTPSDADKLLTKKLVLGAATAQIKVVDHLIGTADRIFSFRKEGLL
jgi:hypothetical protein